MPAALTALDLARCDANYFEAWRLIGRLSDPGVVHEAEGVTCVATGVPIEWANIAFVTRRVRDPAATVAAIIDFFDARSIPFIARMREAVAPEMEDALVAAGIPYSDTVPGMLLANASTCRPPETTGLRIETVRDRAPMRHWQRIVSESFGLPLAAVESFFVPRYFAEAGLESYLGYIDDAPVCTSTLLVTNGIAGVHNVGTLASHRRRGLGEAMTAQAVVRGAELGCGSAFLQASEMGQPVYQRMGFETVAPYRTYHRRS